MPEKAFTIMMMGPEAVGKTSLLATMYKELGRMSNHHKFTFIADNDTGNNLESAYQKLSRIIEQETFTSIKPLLEGTRGIIGHRFDIAFRDKKELEVIFYDIAGGLINVQASNEDFKTFRQHLNNSTVIINVIDGAALVEGTEIYADRINKPTRIKDLLTPALRNEQDHLVLFVITKCETWLKPGEWRYKLEKKFEERYKEVINLIEERSNAVGVLIPLKTLGCVEFSWMDARGQDEEKPFFVRKMNIPFKPEFTDQPLRYALGFVLSSRLKNQSLWQKFLWKFTNKEIMFKESLFKFVRERDTSFKKYGNISLLDITES